MGLVELSSFTSDGKLNNEYLMYKKTWQLDCMACGKRRPRMKAVKDNTIA